MTQFNFIYDPNVSLEQRIGFEMAAAIWSTFLLDDVNINLRITATDSLNNGQAVGGAIPIFHEQHYGVYREYLNQDIASAEDHAATDSLQEGNTVDVLIDGEVIDGNSTIMLTSAQAKALGMNAPLVLDDDNDDEDDNDDADNDNDDNDANDESASYNNNNSYDNDDGDNDNDYDDDESNTWDRNLVDADAQDGYIIINNSYTWNYDFTRQSESPAGALDFLTMALHEIGHTLGFVSGLDGLLETFELHSGETQAAGFTALDMFRHTIDSQVINNPDGDVADLTLGANAYFSLDGETALANFSSGQNTEVGGDGYQASHWERLQQAVGIMDPTLGYQERTNISYLDLQAMDVLGWDINYAALEQGLNFQALHAQALHAVAADFSIGVEAVETAVANGQDWYTLGYGSWWQAFKDQMIEMGYGGWWQEFEAEMLEIGYGQWWQVLHQDLLEIGYGQWWQAFENQVLEMGYGQWWQQFETEMLEMGYGHWWQQFEPQMLEMGYGGWWQVFEQQMLAMGYGQWWQEFEANLIEMGYGSWWQAFESQVLEMGYGSWWQIFEDTVLEMGYGQWWQEFEANMLEIGYGQWWQTFEMGYGSWWQQIEEHIDTIKTLEESTPAASLNKNTPNNNSIVVSGRSVDDILGGIARDWISGGAGDDLLDGKDSDDILLGDKGNDIIYGWTGQDILFGGDGDDLLSGENDNDQLYGEAGADILSGGRGDDFLDGGEGRDVLKGDTDQDILKGGAEDDRLSGGSGDDLLIGGTGEDVVNGGDDDDVLYGDDYFIPVVSNASADHPASNNPLSTNLTSSADYSSGASPVKAFQDFQLRLEAEDFELRNYNKKKLSDASDGKVIATRGEGEAWTAFSGPTGVYNLVVGYYDKANGAAEVTLSIQRQGSGNEEDDDTGPDDQTYTWKLEGATGVGTYQISEVALAPGDRILLKGDRDSKDFARLDYIDVITSGRDQSSETTGALPEKAYTFIGGTSGEGRITRVETESLQLSGGYTRLADPNASEDTVIAATENTPGTATFTYTGQTGVFNLYANYFDSSAGNAQAEVFLNGVSLDRWEFNLNDDATHEQTLGLAVTLNPGDVIQIQGEAGFAPTLNTDEGLVAYWTFDETSGNIAQDAKGIHDATLKNSSTDNSQWGSSPLGGALKLDGVNDYVTVANHAEMNLGTHAQKTISVWFKVDDAAIADRKQVIYEQGGTARGLNLYIHDGKLYAGGWNNVSAESNWTGTFLQTDQIVSGQWHHVALVLDGDSQLQAGALKAYLDGELFGAGAGSQLWQHAGGVGLGAVNVETYFHDGPVSSSGNHTLLGSLDDVRIYNRALNGIQIQEEAALAISAANLVANGSFEDNSISANSWGIVNSLSGWSPTVQSVIEVQELTDWLGNADDGGAWLELDSVGNGGVAQTLSTTAQADYQLSFAYSPRPGVASASNGVAVYWDGQLLDTISRVGDSQNNWQTYTYDVTASDSSTALEFRAIGSSDGVGAFLDDVKVQPILTGDQAIIDYLVLEQASNTVDHESPSPLPEISRHTPNQLALFNGVHGDESTGVFNFDGYNDYGELAGAETGGAMTFAAWVNYDSFNHWSRIFDFGDGAAQNNILLANQGTTNNLVFEVHAGGASHRLSIANFWQANTWMHIAATLEESGRMRIYKDGVLAGETISSVIPNLKTRTHNYIGKSHWSQDGYFEGQLKDLELLDEALDEADVQALYSGELQGNDVNVNPANNQPLETVAIQLEVENMDRSGSAQQISQSFASGGQYVRTGTTTNTITTYENVYVSGGGDDDDDDDGYWTTRPVYTTEETATGMQFSSSSLFSGETGAYDITVGYYDENDGAAEIIVKVDNQEVDRWFTDKNLGSANPNASTFTTRTVAQGLQISNLDLIEIIAIGDNGDRASLDYIEFVKAAELPTQAPSVDLPSPSSASLLGNNDVLRGGAGNDTAYGGEGDDIVYGDEGDDTLYGDFATLADYSLQNGVQVDAATGALDFDGNDDYGELSGVETGGAMTFSAWVNYDSFNHWSRIFDFGDGAANNNILLGNKQGTNTLGLHIYNGNQPVGILEIENFWQTDAWIHVTATIDDSGAIRVYKNGTLAGETVSSVVPTSKVLTHNYIGKSHWSNDGAFDGQLNDVALLNEALSEDAVQSLYSEALLSFGGEIYNGSRYLLTDSTMTWEDAQTYAESLGGNLVTVNDANEEAWLQNTFGTTEGFWIGMNDRLVEGQFEWVSGEAVTYTNWAPGEPNNYGDNQDYGWINYGGANQWDDSSPTAQLHGIIEIKLSPEPDGGNDSLIGGSGDDSLYGGDGDDILNGTDSVEIGLFEQDSLTGGGGADQFILGDTNSVYYSTGGSQDYVVIQDFTVGIDTVQLPGSATDYQQSSQAGDVFLYYGINQDLVAQFENITSLDLSSNVTFI